MYNLEKYKIGILILIFIGIVFSIPIFGLSVFLLIIYIVLEKRNLFSFKIFEQKLIIFAIVFILWHVIGIIFSQNTSAALFSLEKKLSILVLPLLFASITPIKKHLVTVLTGFLLALFLACLILYVGNFTKYYFSTSDFSFHGITVFFNEINREKISKFSFVQFHHPYLGFYIATSLLFIITFFSQLRFKGGYIMIGLFMFLFLLQLDAKMSLIAFFITVFLYFSFLLKEYSSKYFVGLTLLVIISGLVILFAEPSVITTPVSNIVYADGGSRVRNWESAFSAIKDAPLFGYGPGDKLSALQDHRSPVSWESQQMYNAHNQYLDITLAFGLIGLLYWLLLLGYFFWKSCVRKEYFFSLFIALFVLASLTEVFLERFHGVVLFAIMYSLFVNVSKEPNRNATTPAHKAEK